MTNAHSFDAAWHRAGSPSPRKVGARPENLAAGTPIASRKRSESVEHGIYVYLVPIGV